MSIGFPWNFDELNYETYLKAMIESFRGNEVYLKQQIRDLISS
jgi:hypothetical protein